MYTNTVSSEVSVQILVQPLLLHVLLPLLHGMFRSQKAHHQVCMLLHCWHTEHALSTNLIIFVKVKLSLQQAVNAHSVVRRRGLDNRLTDGCELKS
jgi:hypothetical protein